MRIKILIYYLQDYTISNCVKITQYGDCEEYNYILKELDRFKRNLKLQKLASQEIKKRYKVCNIKAAIKLNNNSTANAKLEAASGQFFNIFNIHNAGKKWKILNPNFILLKAKLNIKSQWVKLAKYFKKGKFSYTIILIW